MASTTTMNALFKVAINGGKPFTTAISSDGQYYSLVQARQRRYGDGWCNDIAAAQAALPACHKVINCRVMR